MLSTRRSAAVKPARARNRSCYMVGGDAAFFERCREVFATSASEIFHMGEVGSGAAAKMIVQVVTCINMLAATKRSCCGACGWNFAALQQVLKAVRRRASWWKTGSIDSNWPKIRWRSAAGAPKYFRKA